jgi:RNA polymerase sigma factor (sigma-70 family)
MGRSDLSHLSQISTMWTMLFRAHAGGPESVESAQRAMMERYGGAVYRYLLGAVRDQDAAAELAQEFAVRFLRGDFRRADPDRGRFRDYLKTSLIHLATDYRKAQRERPQPLNPDTPGPAPAAPLDDDAVFMASWRAELLDRTWDALAASHPTQHAVLLCRVSEPELPSPQLADRVGGTLGRPLTAVAVRKSLQRAHAQFAELLVEEVARSIGDPSPDDLTTELAALDLLRYCRSAVEQRISANTTGERQTPD